MKVITNWQSLSAFGIRILTGEACGLTYRYLCDVTTDGKRILEKCFDATLTLAEPWNSGAVGSIMLSPEMLTPVSIFALLDAGCSEVWLKDGDIYGIESTDSPERIKRLRAGAARRFGFDGTAGSRNRHEFTGRVT